MAIIVRCVLSSNCIRRLHAPEHAALQELLTYNDASHFIHYCSITVYLNIWIWKLKYNQLNGRLFDHFSSFSISCFVIVYTVKYNKIKKNTINSFIHNRSVIQNIASWYEYVMIRTDHRNRNFTAQASTVRSNKSFLSALESFMMSSMVTNLPNVITIIHCLKVLKWTIHIFQIPASVPSMVCINQRTIMMQAWLHIYHFNLFLFDNQLSIIGVRLTKPYSIIDC